jgi:hypothetical protein
MIPSVFNTCAASNDEDKKFSRSFCVIKFLNAFMNKKRLKALNIPTCNGQKVFIFSSDIVNYIFS